MVGFEVKAPLQTVFGRRGSELGPKAVAHQVPRQRTAPFGGHGWSWRSDGPELEKSSPPWPVAFPIASVVRYQWRPLSRVQNAVALALPVSTMPAEVEVRRTRYTCVPP